MLLAIVLLIYSWPNFKHVTVDDSQTLFSRPLWLMKEFGLNWNHLWLLFNVVYWFLFKPEFISGAPTISNLEIWTLRRSVLNDKVVTKHAQLHELVAIKWKLYCNHHDSHKVKVSQHLLIAYLYRKAELQRTACNYCSHAYVCSNT